jgi:cytidylate kinase
MGEPVDDVLASQRLRDSRDRERAHGALRPAADAVELDTTGMPVADVIAQVVALAGERGIR